MAWANGVPEEIRERRSSMGDKSPKNTQKQSKQKESKKTKK